MRLLFILSFFIVPFYSSLAQVPVSKEPRHHPLFENDKVRILNVVLPSGDTTLYHVHSTPSVFISFTKTNTVSQLVNQQPVKSTSVAGNAWFENLNPPHIKIHRVWNVDTATFHVMDIELLGKDSGFISKPFGMQHIILTIDTPWARTYKVTLGKNEEININGPVSNFILVPLNEATIQLVENGIDHTSQVSSGQFFWLKANEKYSVINKYDGTSDFILVEVR